MFERWLLNSPVLKIESYGRSVSLYAKLKKAINFLKMLAAAASKSLQSCPTLCNPIDGSPPGSPVPRILQARILEWVAISFSNAWKWKVKVKSLSHAQLLATPWTAAHQSPPSMGLSRQEYWSGLPLPSPKSLWESLKTPHLPSRPLLTIMSLPSGTSEWLQRPENFT